MKRIHITLAAVLALGGCSQSQSTATALSTPAAVASTSASDLAGSWAGDATVVVQWAKQKQLPVKLDIAVDGAVTGAVGDAALVNARLRSGRGQLERSLGWGREYRIHGQLSGDIIQAEQIHRDAVDIVFDPSDGALVGGLNSSGSKFGGKENMILAAGKMRLQRVPSTRPAD